jgi:hypothetical protein
MNIKNTRHNQRIKYAWLKAHGYSTQDAKIGALKQQPPQEMIDDLETYYFYRSGKLTADPTNGTLNILSDLSSLQSTRG